MKEEPTKKGFDPWMSIRGLTKDEDLPLRLAMRADAGSAAIDEIEALGRKYSVQAVMGTLTAIDQQDLINAMKNIIIRYRDKTKES